MKYMLLIYGTESDWSEDERKSCMIESIGICDKLASQGKYLASSPLQSVNTAKTVRVRDGQTLVTDGPFTETTEQLGGYYILELAHLDEAISVASKLPPVKKGTVEIRPLYPLDGLPPSKPIPANPSQAYGQAFMLLCYDDEAAWRAAGQNAQREAMAEAAALTQRLNESGQYISASPLHSVEMATCVRVRNAKREIIDGPYAETHEVLGGYYVILAKDRDEAVRVAACHPGLRHGAVEVRPLFDISGLTDLTTIF